MATLAERATREAEEQAETAAKRINKKTRKNTKAEAFDHAVNNLRNLGRENLADWLRGNTGKAQRLIAQEAFGLTEKEVRAIRAGN